MREYIELEKVLAAVSNLESRRTFEADYIYMNLTVKKNIYRRIFMDRKLITVNYVLIIRS